MRVRADHGADAVYPNLTDRPIEASEEVADGMVDYDAQGRIVGLEILDASKRTEDSAALQQFSFEIPIVSRQPAPPSSPASHRLRVPALHRSR